MFLHYLQLPAFQSTNLWIVVHFFVHLTFDEIRVTSNLLQQVVFMEQKEYTHHVLTHASNFCLSLTQSNTTAGWRWRLRTIDRQFIQRYTVLYIVQIVFVATVTVRLIISVLYCTVHYSIHCTVHSTMKWCGPGFSHILLWVFWHERVRQQKCTLLYSTVRTVQCTCSTDYVQYQSLSYCIGVGSN